MRKNGKNMWIRLFLEAGRRIMFRPMVREPAVPYVAPVTPETRDLTAEQEQATLARD